MASFGPGNGPIYYSGIHCTGYEYDLSYCANYSQLVENCTHAMDVGVRCQPGLGKTSTNSLYRVGQEDFFIT